MSKRAVPRSRRQYVLNSPALQLAVGLPGIRHGPMPDFIEPCLATLWEKPPDGNAWVHEIKYDGYRAQLHIAAAGRRFFTRRGHDWAQRFRPLITASGDIKTHAAVIDGEVVVEVEGRSDFGALQDDLGAKRADRLEFYAFDLLYLDGVDLRPAALTDRKRALAELLDGLKGPIRYSEHLEAEGQKVYRNACALKLEGVVSKRRNAVYHSGRNSDWVKITCRQRDSFRVVGYALKQGRFDGLYLGREVEGELLYAGKVEDGFSDKAAKSVVERLRPLLTRGQALSKKIKKPKAQWVKPQLYADVEYRAMTDEGRVRHPSFKGLREDL